MRTSRLRVVRYRSSKTSKWAVDGLKLEGKRKRRFFRTQEQANSMLRTLRAQLPVEGEVAITLSHEMRAELMSCAEALKPFGKSISDATKHYIDYLKQTVISCTVSELFRELYASKEKDGVSSRYLADLRYRLPRFEDDFGYKSLTDLHPGQMDDWLRNLRVAPLTRNGFRRVLLSAFEYAKMRRYISENPFSFTAVAKVAPKSPSIFTPDEMDRLLCSAPAEFVPYLAIGGFAGLRSAEIERLDWSEIDLRKKLIHVRAEKSKTAQRRFVRISENLLAWLMPHAREAGKVMSSGRVRSFRIRTCEVAQIEWKDNALRHSYGSYHLAAHQNAASTALEMGHVGPAMLFSNYRELVTPEAAAHWWSISPAQA